MNSGEIVVAGDAAKLRLMAHVEEMADDYAQAARDSDNPKDKKEFLEFAFKANGLMPKENNAPNLPTFHITIGSNGAFKTQIEPAQADVVEVEAVEVPTLPPEKVEQIERSLSIFDLDFQPIE